MTAICGQIFLVFLSIYLISFGGVFGVLPELERLIVQQHHWLSHDQFIQAFVLGQFLPGPNMVMCPLMGFWIASWPGFVAGFFGIYAGPFVVMGLMQKGYERIAHLLWVKRVETSLRPVVIGLLASSAIRLGFEQIKGTGPTAWISDLAGVLLAVFSYWLYVQKKTSGLIVILAGGLIWLIFSKVF